MIVVDASAAFEALSGNSQARALLVDNHVTAPHLIDTELMHVIRKHLLRKDISILVANTAISILTRFEIERVPTFRLNSTIWQMRDNLTPYDATYVALAQQLDIPLLTSDLRMARTAERYCQTITLD